MNRFIVLEGMDGSGTTTQCRLVAEALRSRGHKVYTTREPSCGYIGKLIRIFLSKGGLDPRALALLFAADRLDHLDKEIKPALSRGEIVICDRYFTSSLVYQSLHCDSEWIEEINRDARLPDICFILDTSPEIAMSRVAKRMDTTGELEEIFDIPEIQHKIAEGYLNTIDATTTIHETIHIDGEASIEEVTSEIVSHCIAAGL